MTQFNGSNIIDYIQKHSNSIPFKCFFLLLFTSMFLLFSGCENQNLNSMSSDFSMNQTETLSASIPESNLTAGNTFSSQSSESYEISETSLSDRSLSSGANNPMDYPTNNNSIGDSTLVSSSQTASNGLNSLNSATNNFSNNQGTLGNPLNENNRNSTEVSASQPSLPANERPVIIIAHGMATNGGLYGGLANRFRSAGYEVLTPSNGDAFNPSHVVNAANQTSNKKVILVGHSAGGVAVQIASTQLQEQTIGVIVIDAARANTTNPNIPHAYFNHSNDPLNGVVGPPHPSIPQQNLINNGMKTLPGGHTDAATGSDAEHYIAAANEIVARSRP
jgi:hypothetical protein